MSSPRKAMAILVSVLALLMPTSASVSATASTRPSCTSQSIVCAVDCWRARHRLRWGPHSPGRAPDHLRM
jgi:hypothetical protein